MSISILVESYCQSCPHFDAVQETIKINSDDEFLFVEHFIKCKKADLCKSLLEKLKGEA